MYRIMIAGLMLETNTFSDHATTLEDYKKRTLLFGQDILTANRGVKTELGAFTELAEKRKDVELVPVIAGNANPGGAMTDETYEYFRNAIVNGYRKADREGKIDGILLALHGAMVTETYEDGEGELLRSLREAAGPDLPILCTLDFHANLTEEMARYSSALFISRVYPHTDCYERGVDAAGFLMDMLEGKAHPAAAMTRIPLIYPHKPTDEGPMPGLIRDLLAESETPGVYSAYFAAGFCRADISIQGSSIYCVTEKDRDFAEKICRKYRDRILGEIKEYGLFFEDPEKACKEAMEYEGLTVLADIADNPGSGLAGDATELIHLLRKMNAGESEGIRDGEKIKGVAVGAIYDPDVAQQAAEAGPGAVIHVSLGGKSGPKVGKPIEMDAYVQEVSDGIYRIKGPMYHGLTINTGLSATLTSEGFTFVVISSRTQTHDLQIFRHNGVEPLDYHILIVKSAVHFRAAYKEIPCRIVPLDMPNITSFDDRKVPFRKVPRPIYPLDEINLE